MSFKITQSPTFWSRVELVVPGEDGKDVTGSFKALFRRLTKSQLEEFVERNRNEQVDATRLAEVMTDWDGMTDDEGPMQFNLSNLGRACELVPTFGPSVLKAFFKAMGKAREGN